MFRSTSHYARLVDACASAFRPPLMRPSSPQVGLRHPRVAVVKAALVAMAIVVCQPTAVYGGDGSALEARGKAILEAHCGRCHAIETTGDSPLKIAPPMRDIYMRFAVRELEEELREGKVSRHKEMPQIAFPDEDVEAILAYLYRLAIERAP